MFQGKKIVLALWIFVCGSGRSSSLSHGDFSPVHKDLFAGPEYFFLIVFSLRYLSAKTGILVTSRIVVGFV